MITAPLPLREQHREQTRRAIAEAAFELAADVGIAKVTAEWIAERAGVSRRTFFNYFGSVDAALSVPIDDFLDRAGAALADRPAGEPFIDSVLAALEAASEPELIERLSQMYGFAADNEVAERFQLRSWQHAEEWVVGALRTRTPDVDELYVASLAAALIGAARVATAAWGARTTDEETLPAYLVRSIGYLATAFADRPLDPKD